jgi:hypothetical protein
VDHASIAAEIRGQFEAELDHAALNAAVRTGPVKAQIGL